MFKQYKYLLLPIFVVVFVATIGVNFFKPFGFFRESNAALVCINADVWNKHKAIEQAGIPVNSYYFLAYQNTNDQLYTSTITFGSAWISLPYYFFSITHIEPNEIGIRLFSLVWLLFTLCSLILLTKAISQLYNLPKEVNPIVALLYLFAPATLWYNVQGYVHEVAVLPFYFLAWYCLVQYIQQQKAKWLYTLLIVLIVALQFDWLCCVQAGIICLYLFFSRKKHTHNWGFVVPVIAVLIGVGYIILHFGNWAGFNNYFSYMESKFAGRTVGAKGLQLSSYINHNLNILVFYALGAGSILLLFFVGLFNKTKIPFLVLLMFLTAILHHALFWGFSNEHDHAAIKGLYPMVVITSIFLTQLNKKKLVIALSLMVVFNIAQYFFLHNYPIRKGIYSNANYCNEIGEIIKKNTTTMDDVVFVNTDNKHYLQIEFYAKKYYLLASTVEEAKQKFAQLSIGKQACFIELNNNQLKSIIRFSK